MLCEICYLNTTNSFQMFSPFKCWRKRFSSPGIFHPLHNSSSALVSSHPLCSSPSFLKPPNLSNLPGTRLPSVMQCSQTACCSWAVPVPHHSGPEQLLKMQIPLEVCWGDDTKGSLTHQIAPLAGLVAAGTGEPPAQNSPPTYRRLQVGLLEPSEAQPSEDILCEFILLFLN